MIEVLRPRRASKRHGLVPHLSGNRDEPLERQGPAIFAGCAFPRNPHMRGTASILTQAEFTKGGSSPSSFSSSIMSVKSKMLRTRRIRKRKGLQGLVIKTNRWRPIIIPKVKKKRTSYRYEGFSKSFWTWHDRYLASCRLSANDSPMPSARALNPSRSPK